MLRKQELLFKAQTEGLSIKERQELRELELWEQKQIQRAQSSLEQSVQEFEDEYDVLNTPRHRAEENNIRFDECPICRKNRNRNSTLLREYNYMQRHPEDYCMKPELHNDKVFALFVQRERIDLDELLKKGESQ